MKNKPPEDTNELLVQLYALSYEQPIAHFQNTALALLKPVVAFDAAIWGTATTGADGIDIHSFHLDNKTPDMVAGYEEVKHLDSASSEMFDKPKATRAFDSSSFFAGRDKRPIRDFMTKFEQPHFLLTTDLKAQANNNASLLHWLTLYRAKQNAHYRAADVERLQVFAPHLQQALALNRALHISKPAVSRGGKSLCATGIVDIKGHVYGHDEVFMALVSKACGEDCKNTIQLPPDLTARLGREKKVFTWQCLVVQCHAEHGLIVVKLREQSLAGTLTAREEEIAVLVAQGRTYKQVAAELNKAPGTVRNQIQTIYRKLQVNNIAELVRAMADNR
jgi:DNA-binding CsgD family transcriptional regulator